jgi:hypothetical protein
MTIQDIETLQENARLVSKDPGVDINTISVELIKIHALLEIALQLAIMNQLEGLKK